MTLELPEPYTTEPSGTGVRYAAGCLLLPSASRHTKLHRLLTGQQAGTW